MTTKKILAMIIALLMVVSVAACVETKTSEVCEKQLDVEIKHYGVFNVVEEGYIGSTGVYQAIMYDRDTKVMYVWLDYRTSMTFSELYNADGSLKIYNSEEKHNKLCLAEEYKYETQTVLYDVHTKVMYVLFTWNTGKNSQMRDPEMCLRKLYNADGTLKLYNPNNAEAN